MGRILAAIAFTASAIWCADLRTQFDSIKAQGRAAVASEDWTAAERSYKKLLELSDHMEIGTFELYADVVSPLAQVYRQSDRPDELERLYQIRVDRATPGLAKGLAQADLGFFYQGSDVASADQIHGERLVEAAMKTFEGCSTTKAEGEQCRRRLADTAGIQGAMYFQRLDYKRAEPLFRRVINSPESSVQDEVMLVSLHALRGILILRNDGAEAEALQARAAAFETAHPNALNRLNNEGKRSRTH